MEPDPKCYWRTCYRCGGEGVDDSECTCMDDTCCCKYPDPVDCSICDGEGGWYQSTPPDDD